MSRSLLISAVCLLIGLAALPWFWVGFRSGRDPLFGIRYDEMAGMSPFFSMIVSGFVAAVSAITLAWMLLASRN